MQSQYSYYAGKPRICQTDLFSFFQYFNYKFFTGQIFRGLYLVTTHLHVHQEHVLQACCLKREILSAVNLTKSQQNNHVYYV